MVAEKTITIHMVSSIDGFVANLEDTVDWMRSSFTYPQGKTLTDQDVTSYLNGIDCYIIGSNTYQLALKLGWPYGDKPVYVLSTSIPSSEIKTVTIWDGTLADLIRTISHKNIWVAGGPQLVQSFLLEQLAVQLIITICPNILGGGKPFFKNLPELIQLELLDHQAYSDGMVELTYKIHHGH